MTWFEILANLIINFIAGILIFLLGLFWPIIPKSIRKCRLKKFFGPSVLSDRFVIVYGTLQDLRPRVDSAGNPAMRFTKVFRNGQVIGVAGPHENIVGDCEIRAAGYLLQNIGKIREEMIRVKSDREAYEDLNFTFISLGSPASNQITGFALREPRNCFLNFVQENQDVFIMSVADKTRYHFERKDRAIIVRIRNERFPKNCLFVCAGLGEWGTSGAAWYLAAHWEDLYKEFKEDDFGLVIEVDIGVDSSASRIATLRQPEKSDM
jgi:hypothetical protein